MEKLKSLIPKSNISKAVAVVIVLVFFSQLITFFSNGEIFTISIRDKDTVEQEAASTEIAQFENAIDKSLVCKKITASFVSEAVGQKVTKSTVSTQLVDPKEFSSCLYSTAPNVPAGSKNYRSVSVSQQIKDNKEEAVKEIDKFQDRGIENVETVNNFADEAYFVGSTGQLIARSENIVVNVNVNFGSSEEIDPFIVAKLVASKLL